MKWRVVVEQDAETGDWAAWRPELPGWASAGQTEEEALRNIQEAIALTLHDEDAKDALELDEAVRASEAFISYDGIRNELKQAGRL